MNLWKIICSAVLALMLLACEGKIRQENYIKVKNGMTVEEVNKLLGEPTTSSAGNFAGISGTASNWKTETIEISIHFINGEVISKQLLKTDK